MTKATAKASPAKAPSHALSRRRAATQNTSEMAAAGAARIGVASEFQRASQNRFVYTIERLVSGGPVTTRVELGVVFKDP